MDSIQSPGVFDQDSSSALNLASHGRLKYSDFVSGLKCLHFALTFSSPFAILDIKFRQLGFPALIPRSAKDFVFFAISKRLLVSSGVSGKDSLIDFII